MIGAARCLLAVLLASTGAALAQTPPPASEPSTTVSGLTVQGQDKTPPTFHDRFVESLNFITSRGQPAHLGQLARWTSPVCPVTVGLSPAVNALVSQRVKALDFEAGAPQARRPGRCKPNIETCSPTSLRRFWTWWPGSGTSFSAFITSPSCGT